MKKILLKNIIINFILLIIFVFLNKQALLMGLEETFLSLAIIYGTITIVVNAIFVTKFYK
ncbi:MAG TPA: hypothetical protein VN174_01980 [Candidatus Methanoperedens sp.]|nr:hypothetical protein [Candidatus Methanoperedens sp.]